MTFEPSRSHRQSESTCMLHLTCDYKWLDPEDYSARVLFWNWERNLPQGSNGNSAQNCGLTETVLDSSRCECYKPRKRWCRAGATGNWAESTSRPRCASTRRSWRPSAWSPPSSSPRRAPSIWRSPPAAGARKVWVIVSSGSAWAAPWSSLTVAPRESRGFLSFHFKCRFHAFFRNRIGLKKLHFPITSLKHFRMKPGFDQGGGGGAFHRTCHHWQFVIHWLLPWQQCFIANQNQECHFTC